MGQAEAQPRADLDEQAAGPGRGRRCGHRGQAAQQEGGDRVAQRVHRQRQRRGECLDEGAAEGGSGCLGGGPPRWVDDGTADTIVGARRAAVRGRNAMATETLAGLGVRPDPAAPHLWLPLPEPWGVGQFTAAARDAGVLVSPGDEYTTSRRQSAFGVRIGLNADVDDDALRRALLSLGGLLHTSPRGPNS
nr:hypothetical protein [Streptomyces sp. MK7]